MPSAAHETLIALMRERPEWLAALLAATGHGALPANLRAEDPAARVVDPATVQPDLLLAAENGRWLAVEVQRDDDPAKGRRWLLAAAALHDQRGVMGDVVVVTHARAVANWARSVATVTGPLGTRLSLVPRVVCLTRRTAEALLASRQPELAIFAAWAVHAHRSEGAARIVARAIALGETLDDAALRGLLVRAMINMVGGRLRHLLRERLMDFSKIPEGPLMREIREEIERRIAPEIERRIAPEIERRIAPEIERRVAGDSRAKGRLEGEAEALLRVLARRGVVIDASHRARIAACTDLAALERWLDHAVTATCAADVFGAALTYARALPHARALRVTRDSELV